MCVLGGSHTQSAEHIQTWRIGLRELSLGGCTRDVFFFSSPSFSLHSPLSKVPDLAGWGGLDLPHPAGTRHGPGQLGGGLLHRHLPTR